MYGVEQADKCAESIPEIAVDTTDKKNGGRSDPASMGAV